MWEVFEQVCQERGITAADVSRATGIGQSTFANWKRRRNLINPKLGRMIAETIGVSFEYLMTGKDPEGYYENDETAQIAQAIHDNRELRGLFSAAKDVDDRIISALHKMLLILKQTEERNENTE